MCLSTVLQEIKKSSDISDINFFNYRFPMSDNNLRNNLGFDGICDIILAPEVLFELLGGFSI